MVIHWGYLILWMFGSAMVSGAGAFGGAFLKKRAEDLETTRNHNEVIRQMSEITKATKNIEAKISSELWDRQKRWELRRDTACEFVRAYYGFNLANSGLQSAIDITKKIGVQAAADVGVQVATANKAWNDAFVTFTTALRLTSLVCGRQVIDVLDPLKEALEQEYTNVTNTENRNGYQSSQAVTDSFRIVFDAIRNDLRIDEIQGGAQT